MKNLADFKRLLEVGQKWQAYNYIDKKDLGVRPVARIQSNAVAFKTDRGESWLEFPKAKNCKFPNDKTIEIHEDSILVLSYTLVN